MKRVRTLVGVVGLAPAAFAMALPATAAATTAHTPAPRKPASLENPRKRIRIADTGCTGNTAFNVPQVGDIRAHGWYADNYLDTYVCIGTVVESMKFLKGSLYNPFCKYEWVSYWESSSKGGELEQGNTKHILRCGYAGSWAKESFGIHHSFDIWGNNGWVVVFPTSTYGGGSKRNIH